MCRCCRQMTHWSQRTRDGTLVVLQKGTLLETQKQQRILKSNIKVWIQWIIGCCLQYLYAALMGGLWEFQVTLQLRHELLLLADHLLELCQEQNAHTAEQRARQTSLSQSGADPQMSTMLEKLTAESLMQPVPWAKQSMTHRVQRCRSYFNNTQRHTSSHHTN